MRILNFGSINIDHVYGVDHIATEGETVEAVTYHRFAGGKGANQSAALARAGADVVHAGRIGRDGTWVTRKLAELGVDTTLIEVEEAPTGHAVIQVERDSGRNSIIVFGGANHLQTRNGIERALRTLHSGDFLLLQNEVNGSEILLSEAARRGLRVFFNPAPVTTAVSSLALETLDTVLLNQSEAAALTGLDTVQAQLKEIARRYPAVRCVLTLGADGMIFQGAGCTFTVPAPRVAAVDTTAAGDTFVGYYVASIAAGADPRAAATRAVRAAALCVQRPGAMDSIPSSREVDG